MPVLDVIDRLEAAIHMIQKMGIDVRREWMLEGVSGLCRLGNRQMLVLDQSLSPIEQIEILAQARSQLQSQRSSIS